MSVDAMAPLLSPLAETRQVIAVEEQGHGARPTSLHGRGHRVADGIRHPDVARRLVLASTSFTSDGMHAAALELLSSITPEMFAGSDMEAEYLRLAPNPGGFPTLVKKLKTLDSTPFAWPEEDVRAMSAPTLIIVGDSDMVRLEHAVELFRLRGGGVIGDLAGLPASQLAVLPGTTHYTPPGAGVMDRAEWMIAMIVPFLDAALRERP